MQQPKPIQGQSGAAMVHSNIGYLAREEFLKTWPVLAGKSLDEIYAFGRESGKSVGTAQSGVDAGLPLEIAATSPDSRIPSRIAVLVSQNQSQQNATNITASSSSNQNSYRPSTIVISSPCDVAVEPTASKAPALGAAAGRAAAGVPELVTPPSNTGVNESQPVARLLNAEVRS